VIESLTLMGAELSRSECLNSRVDILYGKVESLLKRLSFHNGSKVTKTDFYCCKGEVLEFQRTEVLEVRTNK